ncbi:MAG: hypothetical protein NE334_12235 [Lentisphaeraceae bacterium]|nr:hypothetical protein [Lentisphaeraceae bacterium]
MSTTTAIFFFTQARDDFVSHGTAVLHRLQEKYDVVHLVAIETLKDLVPELLLDLDSAEYLSADQLKNIDELSQTLAKIHTEQTSYYNYSHLSSICMLLGELRKLSAVHGLYLEGNDISASNTYGKTEVGRKLEANSFYESNKITSLRDHYLKLLDLKPYRSKNFPLIKTSQIKQKIILLELSKDKTTKHYKHLETLQSLLESQNFKCIETSELAPQQAISLLKSATAVISNGGYIGMLAQYSEIPVVSLLAKNSIRKQNENYIVSKQPCFPCLKSTCSQLGRSDSCLEDIHPVLIVDKLEKAIKGFKVNDGINQPWPLKDYKTKNIHIVCIHGLGDAVRFALPLAKACSQMGAKVTLHVREVLESALGIQEEFKVEPLPEDYLKRFNDNETAISKLFEANTPDLIIGLGGSFFDLEVARVMQNKNIPYWGSLCSKFSSNYESSHHWCSSFEIQKSRDLLFSLLGVSKLECYKNLLNPYCDKDIKVADNSVLIHTQAMWPAKTYGPRIELIRNLAQDYTVWNFDNPCDTIGELAIYIKQCKAVLTVDTLVLHLANALETPALLIQGPVWHNKDHSSAVIHETQTTTKPMSLDKIDKESTLLSEVPAQVIADRFRLFLETLPS